LSVSEMTYTVSGMTLGFTHSLTVAMCCDGISCTCRDNLVCLFVF